MEFKQGMKLHNRFDIEVKDSRSGKIKQKAFAENIILNQAWAQILGADIDWFNGIAYGTGTGTISATRTALFTPLSSKDATTAVYTVDLVNNHMSFRQNIVLLETEHVGAALSEVGIISSSSSTLCTHALIKDMNGNPVTINKTNVDIVTIYATVYLRPNTLPNAVLDFARDDTLTTWNSPAGTPPGVISTILGRRKKKGYYYTDWEHRMNFFVGSKYNNPSFAAYMSAVVDATINIANKTITFYARVPAASSNVKGLRSFMITGYCDGANTGEFIVGDLNASNITQAPVVEQIGTGDGNTTDFATGFQFVPANTVIKVDGVAASPTVISGVPFVKNILPYMLSVAPDYRPRNLTAILQTTILENPFYATSYGIDSVTGASMTVSASDDGTAWTQVVDYNTGAGGTFNVPAGLKNSRYWKVYVKDWTGWGSGGLTEFNCNALDALKNVKFSTAPATGAVITAEYTPDCAAKDANHVLDITVTITLAEYIP